MSDGSEIPSCDDDLIEVAAGWLAALDAGSADFAAFEIWRSADARHAAAFAEVAGAWRDLDDVRLLPADLRPALPLTQESAAEPIAEPAAPPPSRRTFLRAAAATGAVAIAGGGLAYRAAARDQAVTRVGERKTVAPLPGLSIELNTDSRVDWKHGAPARVWLERGEIALRLAEPQGLVLLTPGGTFALTQGAYNARLRGASCELAVLAGNGRFGEPAQRIAAGEIALTTGGQITGRRVAPDLGRVTAWRNDTLVLNGESLDYALAEMNRYLPHKIVIGDPALSRLRLGGTFATTNPSEFLQALRTSFGVRATRGANGGMVLTQS